MNALNKWLKENQERYAYEPLLEIWVCVITAVGTVLLALLYQLNEAYGRRIPRKLP